MTELLSWLKDYSPEIVLVMAIGAAALYVLRLIIDKAIAYEFEIHKKEIENQLEIHTTAIEKRIERRSAFEEKILMDRFERVKILSSTLNAVWTEFFKILDNQDIPDGFWSISDDRCEILPLRLFIEKMEDARLFFPDDLLTSYDKQLRITLKANDIVIHVVQTADSADSAEQMKTQSEWNLLTNEWSDLKKDFRAVLEQSFGIHEIRW